MYLKVNEKYSSFNSQLAKTEKNDCFVRALAVAGETDYQTAHQVAKEVFGREERQGTKGFMISSIFLKAEAAGMYLGSKKLEVAVLGRRDIKNQYKLKGEVIYRQKTLKSFIESHPVGNYIVTVANHALAVIDGELADWSKEGFKPTRKVQAAYRVHPQQIASQLSLFE
jgi:hypothetical protein